MCGIAGIVELDPRERVDESRLRRMGDVLRHRGPDGEGRLLDGPAGLAHRRLAIVDVAGGHQPMSNEDGTAWIVFNGEIYNHAALRPGLEARGHRDASRSDTETILHLYEEEGERCVERLQGMFAFAIWDGRRQRLLLARDRLGIKPLFYTVAGGELIFASEIKAILAAGRPPEFDRDVLPEYLATGFVAGEASFFRGIRKLQPGRTLTWQVGQGFEERRYWQLPAPSEGAAAATVSEGALDLRRRLSEAVRSHLMSDVPLGLFLSGGIDSTGLLTLMAPMLEEPVRTFAVGFSDHVENELDYARLAAQSAGAEHREVVVSPREFFGALPRLVRHEDEPLAFPASVPLYFLSRLASEHVKVVLTGEGADELFLGYNRYRVAAWNERLGGPYWRLTPAWVRARVRHLAGRLPSTLRRYAQRSFVALDPGPRHLFYENFAVFAQGQRQALLANAGGRDPYAESLLRYEEAPGGALDRMSHADLQTYLVRLLMKQDQMSMAASLESRVPFLDHLLVEHVVSMPARLKLRGLETKAILRAALDGLVPPAILKRKKMGFPVPVGRWLRGEFWPVVEEFVLGSRARQRDLFDAAAVRHLCEQHRSGQAAHGDRLWLLVNLEIWQRLYVDGEDTAAIMRAA
jgi:asparagine synthase (glutamine-hydrolysing)